METPFNRNHKPQKVKASEKRRRTHTHTQQGERAERNNRKCV